MPISYTEGLNKYYLHYDQVGSLRAISDNNHNIIKEIVYDSFGNIVSDSNPNIKVPFAFAGGLYDEDTKLLRFGYRDYDSFTGKWTAKDPIDFDGDGYNLYGYVLNDPVNFMDVNGLWIAQAVGAATGFGFEAFNQYKMGKLHVGKLIVATGTGAIGGFGSSALKNIIAGTVANTTNSLYQQSLNKCDKFNVSKVLNSSFQGAAGAIMGRSLGGIGRNIRKSNVVGGPARGNNDYSNAGTAFGAVVGGSFANQ